MSTTTPTTQKDNQIEDKKKQLISSLERIRLAESFPVKDGDFVEKSTGVWTVGRKAGQFSMNKSN